jgi:hypothetical protein
VDPDLYYFLLAAATPNFLTARRAPWDVASELSGSFLMDQRRTPRNSLKAKDIEFSEPSHNGVQLACQTFGSGVRGQSPPQRNFGLLFPHKGCRGGGCRIAIRFVRVLAMDHKHGAERPVYSFNEG